MNKIAIFLLTITLFSACQAMSQREKSRCNQPGFLFYMQQQWAYDCEKLLKKATKLEEDLERLEKVCRCFDNLEKYQPKDYRAMMQYYSAKRHRCRGSYDQDEQLIV